MKILFFRHIFGKYSNINFRENPSSWSGIVPMRTDRQTCVANLIVAARNFANALKKRTK